MSNIDLPRKKKGDAITAADWNILVDAIDENYSALRNKGLASYPSSSKLGYTAPSRIVPGALRAIFKDDGKGTCYTLNPFKVYLASKPNIRKSPTYNNTAISSIPYPAIPASKEQLWLDTLYTEDSIVSSKLVHELPSDTPPKGQMRDVLLLGETAMEGSARIYRSVHTGDYILRENSAAAKKPPFYVTWIAPEEEGATPKFTVRSNGGQISMIDLADAPPFTPADATMPPGAYSFDAASIPSLTPFSGKFAYLVAEITHAEDGSKTVEFSYKGSPYQLAICDCDDQGRPKISRVCLAQYGGAQYVSTSLLLAPIFFGIGGYYIFTPFLSNPQFVSHAKPTT